MKRIAELSTAKGFSERTRGNRSANADAEKTAQWIKDRRLLYPGDCAFDLAHQR